MKEKDFKNKLTELVKEFNSLGLKEYSMFDGWFNIEATGEVHYHDYFICLNVNGLKAKNLSLIMDYIKKYNGTLCLHPAYEHNVLAIRIDDDQFFRK